MKKKLLIGLSILTICSLTACGKKTDFDDVQSEPEGEYAINEVRDTTEEDIDITESTIDSNININNIDGTEETTEEPVVKDQIYNIDDDKHINDVRDMSVISIDGQLISFPFDYEYAVEKFGELSVANKSYSSAGQDLQYSTVNLEEKAETFEVYATPKTGKGTIKLIFTGDGTAKTLPEMTCYKAILRGGDTTEDKIYTLALPQHITFGSSYEDIKEVFGSDPVKDLTSNKNTDFRVYYYIAEKNWKFNFVGYDGGLNYIELDYNYLTE